MSGIGSPESYSFNTESYNPFHGSEDQQTSPAASSATAELNPVRTKTLAELSGGDFKGYLMNRGCGNAFVQQITEVLGGYHRVPPTGMIPIY